MSEIKLLPCPFCGGEVWMSVDSVDAYNNGYTFCCDECDMYTSYQFSNEKKAIEHWNTRKPMERIVDRLEMKQPTSWEYDAYWNGVKETLDEAIEIVKEEGGTSDC